MTVGIDPARVDFQAIGDVIRVIKEAVLSMPADQHGRTYRPHVGPINWNTWPFATWPLGWSIEVLRAPLAESDPEQRIVDMAFEIGAQIPESRQGLEMNADLFLRMCEDAVTVLEALKGYLAPDGSNVDARSDLRGSTIEPIYSEDANVQGIQVDFVVGI